MTSVQFPTQRTAIITGAASARGIGRAAVSRMAAAGWSVALFDIDEDAAVAAATSLQTDAQADIRGFGVNIADPDAVDRAVGLVESTMPPIVGLVNCAGISSPVPFLEVTVAEWDRVFSVNARGAFLITHRVMPGMVERGVGRIVHLSSASAQRGGGTFGKVPYSASKAAVIGLVRSVAREVGKQGVTINAIAPGPIDTDIMGGTLSDARRDELVKDLVVNRIGTVDDVAALVTFLMSEDAGYITGATYNVNGGLIID